MIAATMPPKSPVMNIFDFLNEGVKKFGLKEVEQKLKELYDLSTGSRHKLLKKKICSEISAEYGYSVQAIIRTNKRGTITQAKAMMMIMFHHHLNMSQEQISVLFTRDKSLISRRIKAFNAYMGKGQTLYEGEKEFEKIYSDKNFMRRFETINTRINDYKASWKHQ